MFFRPSFCSNCSEKIERAEWFPWTSRRFCAVCETEFKLQDLIPRVVVVLGVLGCLLGLGSYFKSGSSGSELSSMRRPQKFAEQPAPAITSNTALQREGKIDASLARPRQDPASSSGSGTRPETQPSLTRPTAMVDGSTYYCGAETKKGTPCSRRVKGKTRCFQHTGMPAMLPADKLRIKQG